MKTASIILAFAVAIGVAAVVGVYGARYWVDLEPSDSAVTNTAPTTAEASLEPSRRVPASTVLRTGTEPTGARASGGASALGGAGASGGDGASGGPSGAQTAPPSTEAQLDGGEALPASGDPAFGDRNREAIAALEAGEFDAAIEGFEVCLEALPDNEVLAGNLAEALVRKAVHDHEHLRPCGHCVDLLNRAIDLAPGRADLLLLRERWEREAAAEEDFWRESSQHFDLAYDGSRDEILWGSHRILELLEEGYTDFGELFARYPVEEGQPRIAVSLYRRESFDLLTGLGDWAGGAFDGVVRVPVGDFELEEARLRRILRHELVHAFIRAVGGTKVPGWLNEGLAQWLEDDRGRLLALSRDQLAGRELFPLERLEGSLATWDNADEIALAYAQSVLFTDHVATEYGELVLVQLVEGCAQGDAPATTFKRLTNVDLAVVLSDLAEGLAQ